MSDSMREWPSEKQPAPQGIEDLLHVDSSKGSSDNWNNTISEAHRRGEVKGQHDAGEAWEKAIRELWPVGADITINLLRASISEPVDPAPELVCLSCHTPTDKRKPYLGCGTCGAMLVSKPVDRVKVIHSEGTSSVYVDQQISVTCYGIDHCEHAERYAARLRAELKGRESL